MNIKNKIYSCIQNTLNTPGKWYNAHASDCCLWGTVALRPFAAVVTNFVMAPFKPFKYEGMQVTE
jgi:hypothetical protein